MTQTAISPAPVRAIVTGHSRGLGAALAELLLERQIDVLGVGRSAHPTLAQREHPANSANAATAAKFVEASLDLADPAAVEKWLASGALQDFAQGAQCVLLFNNAGTVDPIAPLGAQDASAIARAVTLNVAAPLMLANALATVQAGERRIVHLSSGAARNAYSGWSVYCATKAALDHHARAVALDAPDGVRIGSVAPGVVDTGMQATIRATSVDHFPLRGRFEELKQTGKLTSPEDCARQLIDYALSDAFGTSPTADVRELA
ncbi:MULTISPECIES: SDR family oxidoreductase [unclassified Paraburkholderia]|uniref:SDR family oxidoreductase n=1 Tax=unclassified Paraburkholderia TaxID=2615204 RepID=UPI002AB186CA|nr:MULTISPECIES: SDR family oxidoreductase [unclassified Paraburkholderia]